MSDRPVESRWKFHGVRVVHANELDVNTAQTPDWVDNTHPDPAKK